MWATGGVHRALERGADLGCDVVQVFTRNPSRWNSKPLSREQVEACRRAQAESGVRLFAAHDSYLINLASPDEALRKQSLAAMRDELARADLLGIEWVVTHMGAHLGEGVDRGLARLVDSLNRAVNATPNGRAKIALEVTAGQGTALGARFEHLAAVLQQVRRPERFGVCLDTCHVHAAGYAWRGQAAYDALWAEFDSVIGLDRLKLLHANDAKRECGSRVDRHEHLGKGRIGLATFRRLVRDPRLARVPIILETPQAETMHRENLELLRSMRPRACAGRRDAAGRPVGYTCSGAAAARSLAAPAPVAKERSRSV
jgi:deoxyribonuclease-4